MKTLTSITIKYMLLTCLFIQANAQKDFLPYIVNPLIGDTLSLEERNYYQLFPKLDEFHSAVFFLNPDSTLSANVKYSDNGILKDTLIENYKSLKSLNYHIYARDALEKGLPLEAFNYQASGYENGAEVSAYLIDGRETSGELLSVRRNSLLLLNPDCDERLLKPECINQIKAAEINKLVIKGNSNLGLGIGLGILASVIVGAIIFQSYDDGTFMWGYDAIMPTTLAMIGCISLGVTIGIATSTPDEVIKIYSEKDIRGLRSYSRYPEDETNQLKKIQ